MNKTLIALATVATLAAAVPFTIAQAAGPGPDGRGGPNIERMTRVLDLTPAQQEKMNALFAEQAKRRQAMRAAMQEEMKTILTKEQYAKMEEMRKFRDQYGHGRRGGQGRQGGFGDCRGPGNGGIGGPNR